MGVKLHVDLETLQLNQGPGQRSAVASLRFKRGDSARLQVVFLENGVTPTTIGDPGTLEIQFGIKPRNQFDRSYLAHSADWSMPSEGDDAPTYECVVSFNTLPLNSALNVGSATAEELPEITLVGEITWREGTGEPTSTRTFLVVVENDVNRGTEETPLELPGPEDWLEERVTTASILAKLKGSANNPVRIGAEYLPPIDATQLAAQAVLYTQAQSPSQQQQFNARNNIGLGLIEINPGSLAPGSGIAVDGLCVNQLIIGYRKITSSGDTVDFGSSSGRFAGLYLGSDYFPIAGNGSGGGISFGGSSSGPVEVKSDLYARKSIFVGSTGGTAQISQYNSKLIMGGATAGSAYLEASFYGFPFTNANLGWSGSAITTGSGSFYVGGSLTVGTSGASVGGTLSVGLGGVSVNGQLRIGSNSFKSSDGTAGISTSIAASAFTGKTLVIKDGIITSFA